MYSLEICREFRPKQVHVIMLFQQLLTRITSYIIKISIAESISVHNNHENITLPECSNPIQAVFPMA